jgi:hypothetical protein
MDLRFQREFAMTITILASIWNEGLRRARFDYKTAQWLM